MDEEGKWKGSLLQGRARRLRRCGGQSHSVRVHKCEGSSSWSTVHGSPVHRAVPLPAWSLASGRAGRMLAHRALGGRARGSYARRAGGSVDWRDCPPGYACSEA